MEYFSSRLTSSSRGRADVQEAVEHVEESEEATVEVPVEAVEQVSRNFDFFPIKF